MMLLSRWTSAVRSLATRADIKNTLRSTARVSRGIQVNEIQKRLADYERESTGRTDRSQYEVDSIMAEKLVQGDKERYAKVLTRRETERQELSVSRSDEKESKTEYPLAGIQVENSAVDDVLLEEEKDSDKTDRGFYVEGGQYVDEYISGTAKDIPDDEAYMSTHTVYGSEDAVEHIDFQLPGQSTSNNDDRPSSLESGEPDDWTEQYGTVDPTRAASKKGCSGCGAKLHCKDSSLPGFLPMEVFDKVEKKRGNDQVLCKRCHLLKNHNFLLNVNVCPVDYASMMSHLRMKEEALILMVVDVTDLPGSIHRQLPNIIGARKPMIVIGNKVDLLPPDAEVGYLRRFKEAVEKAVEDAGFRDNFNLLHTALVSAKTGYGIEDLVTEIHLKWSNVKLGMRNDIYLVGCTNAGKSTLFNSFLQSDLCKVRAVDLVERATTSIWPGTTISLLKFPVMKLSPYRLEMRRRRLLQHRAWEKKEMYARKLLLQDTGDEQYAVLKGTIQNTYKDEEDELQPAPIRDSVGGEGSEQEESRKPKWSMDDPLFTKGIWCYDTPGTVNEQQVTNLFTLDELVQVLPRKLLRPRTALVPIGSSLLIAGVGRVDVVACKMEKHVLLTTFVSDALPLNVVETSKVDEFLSRYLKTSSLVVPCGGEERMKNWPDLKHETFNIRGNKTAGAADLVLSSIGWVMVNSPDRNVEINVATPNGRGIAIREPILPHSAKLRGKRLPGSQFYKVEPVEFPVNLRRIKAEKNRRKYKMGR